MRVICKRRSSIVALSVAANVANYNAFTAAGSPSASVNVVLTVQPGVIVYSLTSTAALLTSGFATGSVLTIINQGWIAGMRGAAGAGGSTTSAGGNGGTAGNAIDLGVPVTIDNNDGYIYGGGGGGGGGAGGAVFAGGSGGLGAGNGTNAAAAGSASSGDGGKGGAGGTFGMVGVDGAATTYALGGSGGSPGKAIALNGYAITWAAGNNTTQVRGAVS